ncbi:MAG: hypothetical protein ABJK37_19285 [Paraglaciecola sp.]|uniref:hypothetical protein n=1 Tax=Paraglaciecola sp. TaxID=1920173 RepID=UPI003298C7FF
MTKQSAFSALSALTAAFMCASLTGCNDEIFLLNGEHHVRVFQDDQAISCEDSSAISVKTHGKLLIDEDIELHCAQKGSDGMNYIQSCGAQTGSINIFTIHFKDLSSAESLGFSRLSTLPDAQFDEHCEYDVISDSKKNGLLNQLDEQSTIWQANKTASYQFRFHMNFSDCPTFAPTPTVTIKVVDDAINSVYDLDNDTFLSNIADYHTLDELFTDLQLRLKLMPVAAGLSSGEPTKLPTFNDSGMFEQYFIDAGTEACDAANYTLSDLELL